MARVEDFEYGQKEIEERISMLEIEEEELRGRLRILEERESEIEKRLGIRRRVLHRPRQILEDHGAKIKKKMQMTLLRSRGKGRDRLEKEIKTVMERPKEQMEVEGEVKEVDIEERKKRLKGEVKKVMEKYREGKKEAKEEIVEEAIEDLKLTLDEKHADARILFELLMKEGVVRIKEATKKLNTDEKVVEGWAKDLEDSGLIEVNEYSGGVVELKIKYIEDAVEKAKEVKKP